MIAIYMYLLYCKDLKVILPTSVDLSFPSSCHLSSGEASRFTINVFTGGLKSTKLGRHIHFISQCYYRQYLSLQYFLQYTFVRTLDESYLWELLFMLMIHARKRYTCTMMQVRHVHKSCKLGSMFVFVHNTQPSKADLM